MKIFKYNDSPFSIQIPDNWVLERDKNVISIYDPQNGFGALQISIYYVDILKTISIKTELLDFLAEKHLNVDVKEQNGYAYCNVNENGTYWKYWLIRKDTVLAFATYSCGLNDSEKESEVIENIIQSAML